MSLLLVAAGKSVAEILDDYLHLDELDVVRALEYAAWRGGEIDVAPSD